MPVPVHPPSEISDPYSFSVCKDLFIFICKAELEKERGLLSVDSSPVATTVRTELIQNQEQEAECRVLRTICRELDGKWDS